MCTSQTRGLPVCVHLHGGGRKSCVYRLLLEELGSALPSDGYSKSCSTVNSKWRGETSTLSWETEDPWDVGFFLKLGMGWLLLSLVHPSFLSKTPSPKHEHTESSPTQRKCPTLQYSFQNLRFQGKFCILQIPPTGAASGILLILARKLGLFLWQLHFEV